jgi:hypothetical protein
VTYTDKTLMPFGKYKDTPLIDVPADYLMWFYEQEWASSAWIDLYKYVENNLRALKAEKKLINEKRSHIRQWDDYDIHDDWGDRDEY